MGGMVCIILLAWKGKGFNLDGVYCMLALVVTGLFCRFSVFVCIVILEYLSRLSVSTSTKTAFYQDASFFDAFLLS